MLQKVLRKKKFKLLLSLNNFIIIMYIIMKLALIGILFIFIIIIQIYRIIKQKEVILNETFDLLKKYNYEKEFRMDSIKKHRNDLERSGSKDQKTSRILREISNYDFNDFAILDGNDVLVKQNDKYVEGYDNRILPETKKKIDKCRSLKKCDDLKRHPECGYCGTTNKFDFHMGGKIAPDVCPDHKTRGNMWTQGSPAVYDCKKMKQQLLCDSVKNCMQMEEGSKIGRLCGWCPGDSKAKVKNASKLLKYEQGREPVPTKVKGDICPDLNVKMPEELGGGVWFSELITAGNCPECEKPDANGNPTGALGRHSDKCINSLWQAPFSLKNIRTQCSTSYNDRNANAAHYKSSRYATMPYYRLSAEMKRDINLPLINFQSDYNNTVTWRDQKRKPPRRKYNVYNLDWLWRRCFGQNRKRKF